MPQVFGNLSPMSYRRPTILAALAATVALAGCGAGASLSTGSLGGQKAAPGPKPVTASDRALYVATTVARAQRCGFYFNPDEVKANYLAAEAQAGTPPEVVQKVTKEFDYARGTVASAAAEDEGYCTEGKTREVKAALTRQIAGDFNPPQSKQQMDVSWFDSNTRRPEKFDTEAIFDESKRKPRSMGGDE